MRTSEGHLVLLQCGHRGKPNRIEEKRISRLLRKSGFIPMLEELYNMRMPENKQRNEQKVTAIQSSSPEKA